jgi:hypothetical protein
MVNKDYSLPQNNSAFNGIILKGNYSNVLKNKIAEAITHMNALEKIGTPIVPYIAVWKSNGGDIWYEYAGERLKKMLGSKALNQLAGKFRDNLSKRYSYKREFNTTGIVKNVYDKRQINQSREFMRRMAEKDGSSEAIYKID